MSRTVLQIPMTTDLREAAEREAKSQGFSSLQEAVRVILRKLSQGSLGLRFEEQIQLSPKAIKRYDKMTKDMESGKVSSKIFNSVDDLMEDLNS